MLKNKTKRVYYFRAHDRRVYTVMIGGQSALNDGDFSRHKLRKTNACCSTRLLLLNVTQQ